jgi:hypothetical protein
LDGSNILARCLRWWLRKFNRRSGTARGGSGYGLQACYPDFNDWCTLYGCADALFDPDFTDRLIYNFTDRLSPNGYADALFEPDFTDRLICNFTDRLTLDGCADALFDPGFGRCAGICCSPRHLDWRQSRSTGVAGSFCVIYCR